MTHVSEATIARRQFEPTYLQESAAHLTEVSNSALPLTFVFDIYIPFNGYFLLCLRGHHIETAINPCKEVFLWLYRQLFKTNNNSAFTQHSCLSNKFDKLAQQAIKNNMLIYFLILLNITKCYVGKSFY